MRSELIRSVLKIIGWNVREARAQDEMTREAVAIGRARASVKAHAKPNAERREARRLDERIARLDSTPGRRKSARMLARGY